MPARPSNSQAPNAGPFRWFTSTGHMGEILRGTTVAFMLTVMAAGLSFAFHLYLARLLGAAGSGAYVLALTFASVATVVGRLGLDNAMVRFIAASAASEEWDQVRGVYQKGMLLALGASSLTAVLVYTLAPVLADSVLGKPDLLVPIRLMSLSVVPASMVWLHGAALRGLKRILASQLVQTTGVPACSLVGLLVLAPHFGVRGAILAFLAANTLCAVLGYHLWRKYSHDFSPAPACFSTTRLLRASTPLLWVASINLAMTWASTFALGATRSSVEVGVFGAASKLAFVTTFMLLAVNSIAAPKFAALHKRNDMVTLEKMARRTTQLMAGTTVPLLIIFLLWPKPLLHLFGPEFVIGATALRLLALGQFLNVTTGSVGILLVMCGYERAMRNCVAVAATANIIANTLLTPWLGISGAALAAAGGLIIQNILATIVVSRTMGMIILPFPVRFRQKPGAAPSG